MLRDRRALGSFGEDLALQWLEREGYRIVARNLRTRRGEIDLVALEGATLCFVEVRLRSSAAYGSSAASVDARKQRRLIETARELLARERFPRHAALRFDVVAIDGLDGGTEPHVELVRDAFSADGW